MEGIIKSVKIYPVKGAAGQEKREVNLVENFGLEGDSHAKGGERQVSILFAESFITDETKQGLCLSRFKENITIAFSEPVVIQAGSRFEAGEALLEITGETKHCHAECPLFEAGKSCSLAGLNLFARVLKGGTIRPGDKVVLLGEASPA